jgi:asparagine synthetase B (glutamine-hydrolysing)
VGVALSGGIDSTSVLLTLLDLGCEVRTYTFCLEGHQSKDLRFASENAATLGVPWRSVMLPKHKLTVISTLRQIVALGVDRKTTVETSWPFLHLAPVVHADGLRWLVTGHCSDGHFGSSRVGAMFHREADKLDELRRRQFSDPNFCAVVTVKQLLGQHSIGLVAPYRSEAVVNAYLGYSWEECNKPSPKEPVWCGYDDLTKRLRLSRQPINLQLGDSGVAARLAEVAAEAGFKSPVTFYRALRRKAI